MKHLSNFRSFAVILALVITLTAVDASAQRRKKPVLKKKPVAVKTVKVTVPVYTVDSGTILRARMNSTISSKTAVAGSTFTATVTEPVYASNGSIVIPTGSIVTGRVDQVTKAAKGGKPGSIEASFTSVRLPNGRIRAINGSLTDLDSKSAKSDNEGSASGDKMKHRKVIFIGGGGVGGAVIGGAIGGGKGALIGGIVGAVGGLITENQTKGEEATVKNGTEFGVYLNQAVSLPKFAEATVRP